MPTDSGSTAARLDGVRRTYPGGVTALDGVSLDIARGSVTVIAGPNGSGKTTLLQILAGALEPSEGRVERLGDSSEPPSADVRARLGHVPQDLALDPEMTGREILDLFSALHGLATADAQRRATALASTFGLDEHIDRRVSQYSGGLRRRLHLATGAIHEPELLLLDEPTAGLDPDGRTAIWNAMTSMRDEGRTVVVVTHDLDDAERHADRVVLMHGGTIGASGTPAEVVEAHGRPRLYFHLERAPRTEYGLRTEISRLDTVREAAVRGAVAIVIPAGDPQEARDAVIETIRRSGGALAELRYEAASLTIAYRTLTGQSPAPPTERGSGKGGGGGGGKGKGGGGGAGGGSPERGGRS